MKKIKADDYQVYTPIKLSQITTIANLETSDKKLEKTLGEKRLKLSGVTMVQYLFLKLFLTGIKSCI